MKCPFLARIGIFLALILIGSGCGSEKAPAVPEPQIASEKKPSIDTSIRFEDRTASSGIDFAYRNGEEVKPPHLSILESLGGGLALIDFNQDGLQDVFIPGGGHYGGVDNKTILGYPPRLYRNDGDFKFTDVTQSTGLSELAGQQSWFYSHGVAVGDYDRDGWPDLLVTGWRRIALFHNEPSADGGRRFVDVSAKAGLDRGVIWATSAGWADFDGDGFSDLFVCQYVNWSFSNHPDCNYDGSTPDVCPPKKFDGLPSLVYLNNGDGTFREVGEKAGISRGGAQASKALGVVIADLNADGKPDVYVANDTVENFLYMNHSTTGQIKFEEKGLIAGVALDGGGSPNGSMGLDVGDPERTGKPALWVTNYENEFHALYRNLGRGDQPTFVFATQSSGVGAIGQKFVGWGTGFADFDHNGWEDLFIANGHAIRYPAHAARRQRPVLFTKNATKFIDVSSQVGDYFKQAHLSRGVAIGDLDNDGRLDLVVCHMNDKVSVLRNTTPTEENHWIGFKIKGEGNRDIVGAKVVIEVGEQKQTRFAKGGGSYASSPDRRLHFGVGPAKQVDRVTIHWPNGTNQEWTNVACDKYHTIQQSNKTLGP